MRRARSYSGESPNSGFAGARARMLRYRRALPSVKLASRKKKKRKKNELSREPNTSSGREIREPRVASRREITSAVEKLHVAADARARMQPRCGAATARAAKT